MLRYGDQELELKLVPATEGASGMEISKLLTTLGVITLDPGFTNTGSTTSAVTYIDGDVGILRYRGYPIEQLAQSSTFLETSYLLIHGELPSTTELEAFIQRISRHTMLHEDLKRFFDGFPRDAHPMPVLSSAVSALSTFYQDALDPFNPRTGRAVHHPAAGQAADDRRLRLQEVRRAAAAVPGQLAWAWWRTSCGCRSASRPSRTRSTRSW